MRKLTGLSKAWYEAGESAKSYGMISSLKLTLSTIFFLSLPVVDHQWWQDNILSFYDKGLAISAAAQAETAGRAPKPIPLVRNHTETLIQKAHSRCFMCILEWYASEEGNYIPWRAKRLSTTHFGIIPICKNINHLGQCVCCLQSYEHVIDNDGVMGVEGKLTLRNNRQTWDPEIWGPNTYTHFTCVICRSDAIEKSLMKAGLLERLQTREEFWPEGNWRETVSARDLDYGILDEYLLDGRGQLNVCMDLLLSKKFLTRYHDLDKRAFIALEAVKEAQRKKLIERNEGLVENARKGILKGEMLARAQDKVKVAWAGIDGMYLVLSVS